MPSAEGLIKFALGFLSHGNLDPATRASRKAWLVVGHC